MKKCYVVEVKFLFCDKSFLLAYKKYGDALLAGRRFFLDTGVEYVKCYLCDVAMCFDCMKDNK